MWCQAQFIQRQLDRLVETLFMWINGDDVGTETFHIKDKNIGWEGLSFRLITDPRSMQQAGETALNAWKKAVGLQCKEANEVSQNIRDFCL